MPKEKEADLYGGMETEDKRDKKVASMIDGFKGVDSDVPKTVEVQDEKTGRLKLTRVMKRMPAPRGDRLHVVTTGGKNASDALTRKRNRYKLMQSAFQFSPLDDKELWERRMNIAFAEMQEQAFRDKLAAYQEHPERKGDPVARPEQVKHLQSLIYRYKGMGDELKGID